MQAMGGWLLTYVSKLQGRGNSLHFVLNIKKALFITFDNVRDDEGFASIYTRVRCAACFL